MMKKAIVIASLLFTYVALSKEYVIDNYTLTWTAAELPTTSLLIEKTEEKLRVIMRKKSGISFDSIYLSPDEARDLGGALSRANEFYTKQKDTKIDITEVVKVGTYAVTFLTSPKNGFSIVIRQSERFAMGGLVLDRKEALAMSEQLQDIVEKAHFLNNAIKL